MNCEQVQRFLDEGGQELPQGISPLDLDAHFAVCPACRDAQDRLNALGTSLDSWEPRRGAAERIFRKFAEQVGPASQPQTSGAPAKAERPEEVLPSGRILAPAPSECDVSWVGLLFKPWALSLMVVLLALGFLLSRSLTQGPGGIRARSPDQQLAGNVQEVRLNGEGFVRRAETMIPLSRDEKGILAEKNDTVVLSGQQSCHLKYGENQVRVQGEGAFSCWASEIVVQNSFKGTMYFTLDGSRLRVVLPSLTLVIKGSSIRLDVKKNLEIIEVLSGVVAWESNGNSGLWNAGKGGTWVDGKLQIALPANGSNVVPESNRRIRNTQGSTPAAPISPTTDPRLPGGSSRPEAVATGPAGQVSDWL